MISRFKLEEYLAQGYQIVDAVENLEGENLDLFITLRKNGETMTLHAAHEAWELAMTLLGRL